MGLTMSEFEFAQTFQFWIENAYASYTLMISILFAYLLAGHFVAKQLPKAVAVGMTAVYCFVIAGTLLSHLGSHAMMVLTYIKYSQQYPDGWAVPAGLPSMIGPLLFGILPALISIAVGIFYVHFIVRKGQ